MRPIYSLLNDVDFIEKGRKDCLVGEDTPNAIASFALNLMFCLKDDRHSLSCPLKVPGCTIVRDCGLADISVGNAGGGKFSDMFRKFEVIDRHGQTQHVYYSVMGTFKTEGDPHWGTRPGITALICAMDEGNTPVSRLQLNMDTYVKPIQNSFRLTHSGIRSRAKTQPMLDFVEQHVPELLGANEKLDFGLITVCRNLLLCDCDVAEVFGRLTSYLMLRTELHVIEKEHKAKCLQENAPIGS